MDNYSSAGNSLGAGNSEQLYHGRIYSYPSGDSFIHLTFPNRPGPENFVVKTARMRSGQEGIRRVKLNIKRIIGKFAEL